MTIATILNGKGAEVISVTGDTKLGDVVRLLAERRIGAVPVIDGDAVVGIFSERDVIYALGSEGAAALDRPVRERMTSPVESVAPEQPVLAALSLMTRRRIRHLPVIEGQAVVGFVSIGDLVKYRIDKIEAEADAMRQYIQTV